MIWPVNWMSGWVNERADGGCRIGRDVGEERRNIHQIHSHNISQQQQHNKSQNQSTNSLSRHQHRDHSKQSSFESSPSTEPG